MARHNKAVFLDRDGVIVHEVDYLVKASSLKLLRGSARAISALRGAGYKVIVISNQSAIARGMLSLKGLSAITSKLKVMLKAQGAILDAVYYCPHHPDFGGKCACRKPGQAMVRRAAKKFQLDLKASFFVGDTTTDLLTAKRAGIKGLLVRTGYGGKDGSYRIKPAKTFADLANAARWIVENSRP
jgi:D-glycero-D-manno-heptose 1,7-bisphosphate phosphatase